MEQIINQTLNINVNNATPAVPNTGFVTSTTNMVDHLGMIGCSVLFAIILGFTVIAVMLLLQYKRHQQKSSLFLGTGLLAVSFGLFVPSLAMTSTGISGDTPETLETNIDIVTTPEGQVATGDTTITLANDMPDGFAIYAYMENDNALYNVDGSAKIEATALTSSANPSSLTLNSYGILNSNKQYAPIAVGVEQATQAIYVTGTNTPAGTNVNLTFAAKLDDSVPTGTYTGHIVFGIIPTIFIQDVTDQVCQTFEMDKQIPVFDKRDFKQYTIAHLQDGRCWMTQNLDLGYTDKTMTLTPEDSDVNEPFNLPFSSTDWKNDFETAQIYQPDGQINSTERGFDGTFYNWYAATAGTGNSALEVPDGEHMIAASSSICPKNWQLPEYDERWYPENAKFETNNAYYNMLKKYLQSDYWDEWSGDWWGPFELIPNDPLNLYYDGYINLDGKSDATNRHINHEDLGEANSGTWWFNTAIQLVGANGNRGLSTPFHAAVLDVYLPGVATTPNASYGNWDVLPFSAQARYNGASIRCVTRLPR